MLREKTVFIVGAGASKEFGMPIGSELALSISKKLNVLFDDWGRKVVDGDSDLFLMSRKIGCSTIGRRPLGEFVMEFCWLTP